MLIARAVLGAVLLFLGRELNFLFAGAMAALTAIELTPLLPPEWTAWSDTAFVLGLGVIAGAVPAINERAGYFLSGFLAGGYYLSEYYVPGVLFLSLVPFVVGGVVGSIVMGIDGCFMPGRCALCNRFVQAIAYSQNANSGRLIHPRCINTGHPHAHAETIRSIGSLC